jgi:hypothetical protein
VFEAEGASPKEIQMARNPRTEDDNEAEGAGVLGYEPGGTDELGPETGGTDELGPEAGGTDILRP